MTYNDTLSSYLYWVFRWFILVWTIVSFFVCLFVYLFCLLLFLRRMQNSAWCLPNEKKSLVTINSNFLLNMFRNTWLIDIFLTFVYSKYNLSPEVVKQWPSIKYEIPEKWYLITNWIRRFKSRGFFCIEILNLWSVMVVVKEQCTW